MLIEITKINKFAKHYQYFTDNKTRNLGETSILISIVFDTTILTDRSPGHLQPLNFNLSVWVIEYTEG